MPKSVKTEFMGHAGENRTLYSESPYCPDKSSPMLNGRSLTSVSPAVELYHGEDINQHQKKVAFTAKYSTLSQAVSEINRNLSLRLSEPELKTSEQSVLDKLDILNQGY